MILASCAPAAPTETPEATSAVSAETPKFTKTDLTVPSWWGPHEIEGAEGAFQTIFKEQTGLNVKYEFIGSDFDAKVFTNLASDDPYDVITFNADFVPRYLERGVLRPLDDLIERDKYDLTNINEQALDQWTHDGHIYGLTADMGSFHCYFNYDLFEEAGLTPPEPTEEWTWDQLLEWSKALTVKEGDQIVQYGFAANEIWEMWPNMNGTFVFDEGITKSLLDDPKVIEAFEFYQDLMHKEETTLKPGATETSRADLFLAGQLAIMLDGTWQVGYLRSKKDEMKYKWDVGLLPHNASATEWFIPNFTAGWVIPKNAQDVNASWEALKFYASDTFAEKVMFVSLSGLPCTKSALDGAWYAQWPDNPPEGLTRDFYAKVLEHGASLRHIKFPLGSTVEASMSKIDLIYSGEESPGDLLPGLAEEVNAGLAERPWNT
jgi:multiple sugar transport system substrate-binding protein